MTNEWSINTFPKVNRSNLIKTFWKLRLFVVFQTLPFPFVMIVVCTFVQGRRYYAKACNSWVQGHECRWNVKVSQLSVPIFNASTGRNPCLEQIWSKSCEISGGAYPSSAAWFWGALLGASNWSFFLGSVAPKISHDLYNNDSPKVGLQMKLRNNMMRWRWHERLGHVESCWVITVPLDPTLFESMYNSGHEPPELWTPVPYGMCMIGKVARRFWREQLMSTCEPEVLS